jgi:hypothetical protein
MMQTIQFGPGAAVVLALVAIVWRLSPRRTSIPCPSWLARMVELDLLSQRTIEYLMPHPLQARR